MINNLPGITTHINFKRTKLMAQLPLDSISIHFSTKLVLHSQELRQAQSSNENKSSLYPSSPPPLDLPSSLVSKITYNLTALQEGPPTPPRNRATVRTSQRQFRRRSNYNTEYPLFKGSLSEDPDEDIPKADVVPVPVQASQTIFGGDEDSLDGNEASSMSNALEEKKRWDLY